MLALIFICLISVSSANSEDQIHKFYDLIEQQNFTAAIHVLKMVSNVRTEQSLNKFFAFYHFKKSIFERDQGLLSEASESLDSALRYEPENLELQKLRAQLFIESNHLESARQLIQIFIDKLDQIDKQYFTLQLANILIKQEKLLEASQTLENLRIESPHYIPGLLELARLYMKLEEYSIAAELYLLLIQLEDKEQYREGLRRAQHGQQTKTKTIQSYSASFDIRIHGNQFDKYYPTIFRELENCAMDLNNYFGFQPRNPVRILFLNSVDFQHWDHTTNFVQGVSDGETWEIRIALNQVQNFDNLKILRNTLYHEYSHHLVRLISRAKGQIPLWFHEGLARHLEPQRDQKSANKLLHHLKKEDQLFKNEIPVSFGMHARSHEAYTQAASLIDYLKHIRCLPHLISGLSKFTESKLFSDNLKESCGLDERQLVTYWKAWITTEQESEY